MTILKNIIKNFYFQCFFFTLLWQLTLFVLYKLNFIYYNPLIELSDIVPNFLFIFIVSSIFLSPLFSLILVSLIYLGGIILYFFTRQNFTLLQFYNIPELIDAFGYKSYLFLLLILLTIFILYKISKKINFISNSKKQKIVTISLSILILFVIFFNSHLYFHKILNHNIDNFNKFASWKSGGQIYSIIYLHAENENTLNKINNLNKNIKHDLDLKDNKLPELMVLILLESFVPRSELKPQKFNSFLNKERYKSIKLEAPTFGGMSAKTEFEILCGIPELQTLGDMTFNFLGKTNANICLPSLLKNKGYKTLSIVGTKPYFHNSYNAYKALGFEKSLSKDDLNLDDLDGVHPSDSTIFNRAYNEIVRQNNEKLFLYIFTAAGHSPYSLNPSKRPKISNDPYFDRITYTEIELKNFLNKLNKINPAASILIAGDHSTFESIKYLNINSEKSKLMKVWYKSINSKQNILNCSQYFEIPKFFTGQKCHGILTNTKNLLGRNKNMPGYEKNNDLILKLIRESRK